MDEQLTPRVDPSRQPSVVSRTGGIAVRTTERGLPTHMKIGAAEMSRAPEDLARDILSLCQLSALRQQVTRRRDLLDRGFSPAVVRGLNLATEEDLVRAQQDAHGSDDGPPDSWMTSR